MIRSRISRNVVLASFACALTFVGANSAHAQSDADRGEARELGAKGFDALTREDWAAAETLFKQADALYHAPTLSLGLARAETHLNKFVEAWEAYHRVLLEVKPEGAPPAFAKALAEAQVEIQAVEGRRARVALRIHGGDAPHITLDDQVVPAAAIGAERPVNPGTHRVHVEAAGFKPADGTFTVAEKQSTVFELSLERAPDAAIAQGASSSTGTEGGGSTRKTLGLVGLGVGGAGIVVGAITGGLALGKHSTLSSSVCAKDPCLPADASSFDSTLSSYHSLGTISTIGFIAGGALAAGGAVLYFTAPKSDATAAQSPHLTPAIGLGSIGLTGTF